MTHYDTSYEHLSCTEADTQALKDIRDYCTERQWDAIMQATGEINLAHNIRTRGLLPNAELPSFQNLAWMLNVIVGIEGWPVHALGRRYCLAAYIAWRTSGDDGLNSSEVDSEGFSVLERKRKDKVFDHDGRAAYTAEQANPPEEQS